MPRPVTSVLRFSWAFADHHVAQCLQTGIVGSMCSPVAPPLFNLAVAYSAGKECQVQGLLESKLTSKGASLACLGRLYIILPEGFTLA